MRQLVGADVAGAHHVRSGAQVNELAVFIIRNRLAFGNVLYDIELEFARDRALGQRRKTAFLRVGYGLIA